MPFASLSHLLLIMLCLSNSDTRLPLFMFFRYFQTVCCFKLTLTTSNFLLLLIPMLSKSLMQNFTSIFPSFSLSSFVFQSPHVVFFTKAAQGILLSQYFPWFCIVVGKKTHLAPRISNILFFLLVVIYRFF